MRYEHNAHYREGAIDEVAAALDAGNTLESVSGTLQARLNVEQRRKPIDIIEVQRAQEQLSYVTQLSGQLAVAQSVA